MIYMGLMKIFISCTDMMGENTLILSNFMHMMWINGTYKFNYTFLNVTNHIFFCALHCYVGD